MKRNERMGFTLVELLVVIAIIGILVSLLLPAIQASREGARRATCTNQMRQLIVAVHDYEMAHGHLPAGTVNPTGPILNLPSGHHISWIARILPYLEERVLYDMLDLSLSAYHQKNDRARQATIELLICPSNPTGEWPYTNYAGCHHDVEAPIDANNQGVLFLNSQITRDDLKDGATYTLFLGEKAPDNFDLGWLSGTSSTLRNTGSPLNEFTRRAMWSVGNPAWIYDYTSDQGRWSWDNQQVDPLTGELVTVDAPAANNDAGEPAAAEATAGETSDTQPANDGVPPAADEATAEKRAEPAAQPPAPYAMAEGTPAINPKSEADKDGLLPHSKLGGNGTTPLAVGGFASAHIGGVNFAFGDGSIRFIADDASAQLMGRLANRADGNLVDARELP